MRGSVAILWWDSFPVAVLKRYGEDHGGGLGAIVTYYGFFALAPLLVVVMTFATAVFDDASLRDRVLEVVGDVLPFVSPDMQESLAPISGSPWAVAAGVVVALWGGLNAMRVAQVTMNRCGACRAFGGPGWFGPWVAAASSSSCCWGWARGDCGNHRADAGIAAAARRCRCHGCGYGSCATMIGLFAWIALLVQTVVYGTLVNVVRVERLWPRSYTRSGLGRGDRRAAELSAARAALLERSASPADHHERGTPETPESSRHVREPADGSAPIRAVLGIDRG